jgi:TPR repeat protein
MFTIAECYETGNGVARDEATMVEWLRRAADAGHLRATMQLAAAYDDGRGVKKNFATAFVCFSAPPNATTLMR